MEVVSGYFEHLIIYFSPNLPQLKPDVFPIVTERQKQIDREHKKHQLTLIMLR